MKSQNGFVLLMVLLFLFVLTLLAVSGSQHIILENKMQNNLSNHALVFARAELGMQQAVLEIEGHPMSLPASSIQLKVRTKIMSTDDCDNPSIDIQSIAKNGFSTVVLNSRDLFAKAPKLSGCKKIPKYQVVWWKET